MPGLTDCEGGVPVRQADYTNPDGLEYALARVDTLVPIPTKSPVLERIEACGNAAWSSL